MSTECPMAVAFTASGVPKLLYCKQWSCPICRKRKANEWAYIARYGVKNAPKKAGKPRFWTLTLGSNIDSTSEGYKVLARLWDTMRKILERQYGRLRYLAFVEGQPKRSDMPHFHVIIYAHVPPGYSRRKDAAKRIKDFAVHVGFGHQAKDEPMTSGKAAAYVSKYVSKGTPNIPKNFRRVRASRNWSRPHDDASEEYIVRAVGEQVSDYLIRVQDKSGRPLDAIADEYSISTQKMNEERLVRHEQFEREHKREHRRNRASERKENQNRQHDNAQ